MGFFKLLMISDLSFFLDVELFGSVKPPLFPALRTLISERIFLHFAKKKPTPSKKLSQTRTK